MDNRPPTTFERTIGRYQIVRTIGMGGMGEVLLAFDTECQRYVALKKIKDNLVKYNSIKERFLKEAYLTARLNHPSIIPIFSIHNQDSEIYYTMPYIEGSTLKELLKAARRDERIREKAHLLSSSIGALMRIFLSVLQAVNHAHASGLLHRDLKPENIIIGQNGEVQLLDWGLIEKAENACDAGDFKEINTPPGRTRKGKAVGTVTYMAPERAKGESCTIQTEVYALGVILYQLLTLEMPFIRGKFEEFVLCVDKELLTPPEEAAPYRDIPLQLSQIAQKALEKDKLKRYKNVAQMIEELEKFIEGKPTWAPSSHLSIKNSADWEFHENILLSKHIAISKVADSAEWVILMLSKASFTNNLRIETGLKIALNGRGMGFLFCTPEPTERKGLEEGYLVWIECADGGTCQIFRNNIKEYEIKEIGVFADREYQVQIEKLDGMVRVYIDGEVKCEYLNYTPMTGTHVGLLYRDSLFTLGELAIYTDTKNVQVSCLAIPDAFLSEREYDKALFHYRKIAQSFPGRIEGREALFRAGITQMEKALHSSSKQKKRGLQLAISEFEKLQNTPGAPLECLGKSLVYQALEEGTEEINALELGLRKFKRHPLCRPLVQQCIFRLHEASQTDKIAAMNFALLTLRHMHGIFKKSENRELLAKLIKNTPHLSFFEEISPFADKEAALFAFGVELAFWLRHRTRLREYVKKTPQGQPEWTTIRANALYALIRISEKKMAKELLPHFDAYEPLKNAFALLLKSQKVQSKLERFFKENPNHLYFTELRVLETLFTQAIQKRETKAILPFFQRLGNYPLSPKYRERFQDLQIWTLLLEGDLAKAQQIKTENPFLRFALDCKKACKLLNPQPPKGSYHPENQIFATYLAQPQKLERWEKQALYFEKVCLYEQLTLIYLCANEKALAEQMQQKLRKILR